MKGFFAPVNSTKYKNLDGVVLFELEGDLDTSTYLAIRFCSYKDGEVDGDSIVIGDEKSAKEQAEDLFGISPHQWRDLSKTELERIDSLI